MFQTICYIEEEFEGRPALTPTEIELGVFSTEYEAVAAARAAMGDYLRSGRPEYAWWIVRQEGEHLANWIADSRSRREFVVDLTTSRLVEVA